MSFLFGNQLNYTPAEAYEHCREGSVLLDIRPETLTFYKAFDVPDVLYCPVTELGQYFDSLPAEREIIIGDTSGIHTREAISLLTSKGFNHVAGLAGGIVEWERDGLPLRLDNQARLSGSCMCQLRFRESKP